MADQQDYDYDKLCRECVAHPEGMLVLPLVLTDLKQRAAMGREKYDNDYRVETRKDALWEAYEEALDLVCYLRAAIEQQKEREMEYAKRADHLGDMERMIKLGGFGC